VGTWWNRISDSVASCANGLVDWTRRESKKVKPRLEHSRRLARLRKERHQLVRERNRMFLAMGAKVFNLHTRGKVRNADLLALCVKAESVVEALEAKSEEIAATIEEFEGLHEELPEAETDEAVNGEEAAAEEKAAPAGEAAPGEDPA